jgi:hypothetical protein
MRQKYLTALQECLCLSHKLFQKFRTSYTSSYEDIFIKISQSNDENNDCYFVKYFFMHERTSEFYLKLNCQVLSSDSAFWNSPAFSRSHCLFKILPKQRFLPHFPTKYQNMSETCNNIQPHLLSPFINPTHLNPQDLIVIFYLKKLNPVMNVMNIVFSECFSSHQGLSEM